MKKKLDTLKALPDRALPFAVLPQYVDVVDLKRMFKVADDSTVYAMVRRGLLPPPTKLSRKCSRWRLDEVERALQNAPKGASGKNPVEKAA